MLGASSPRTSRMGGVLSDIVVLSSPSAVTDL
ncbi:hypothetical protein Ae406Ps2_4626 [Pseudonocardia sp. Ae406_Ps2]|nr:hypothetical protein Ae406Ps2_4626 [Pseudonocardia sp. Ae406_Ps2]